MPSYPDVLAQRYSDGVIKVGVRGTLNPQQSVRQRKDDADAEAAITRKLDEFFVKAAASGVSASAETDHQRGRLTEEPETQPAPTEVLVCRPKRKPQQPDMFTPMEQLRDFATGSRKRRRPLSECDNACQNAACVADRAERDGLRSQLAAEAAAHMQLREQLREPASESAEGSDAAALAGSALQLAL